MCVFRYKCKTHRWDLYAKNSKTLMEEITEGQNEMSIMFVDRKIQQSKELILPQINLQI